MSIAHNPWPTMTALASKFPCSQRFWYLCEPFDPSGLWDAVNGAKGCPWSSGEVLTAQFLLFVFCGSLTESRFDFAYAIRKWDSNHLEVFSQWVRYPFFAGIPEPMPRT